MTDLVFLLFVLVLIMLIRLELFIYRTEKEQLKVDEAIFSIRSNLFNNRYSYIYKMQNTNKRN